MSTPRSNQLSYEPVRDLPVLGYPNGYPVRETPPFPKQFGSDLRDVNAASRLHRGPATTTIAGFTRDRFHHSPPRTTELEPLGYPNGYPGDEERAVLRRDG